MTLRVRAQPSLTPMHRGRLPACSRRHDHVDGLHRQSGRTASPQRITPSTIMSPTRSHPGSRTEIRLGVRAHTIHIGNRACLAVTRKLLKRSYHTLRELGEEALQPA
jgi:hypothetical protein